MTVTAGSEFISVGAQPNQAFMSEIKDDAKWQTINKEAALESTLKNGQYKDVFGVLQGRNIVFCIDTSGSMYEHLAVIVHQLYQVLEERLTQDKLSRSTTQFNLISFSTLATKWAQEPVTLTVESLAAADAWLKDLETNTSTNTLDALLQALADCTVDTVYLVTDGLPDQRPALVVECVLRNNKGRPIVTVSIGAGSNGNADLLLTDLASVTGGSFRPVTFPLKLPDPKELAKLPKGATVLLHGGVLDRNLDTSYLTNESKDLRWSGDIPPAYPLVRAPPPPDKVVKFPITAAGRLMIGKSVVARHSARGDYRSAVIVDQHSPTCFELTFDRPNVNERCELCHIFIPQDALMHPVTIGDHVLAPVRPGPGPYEPGNVVRGEDTRRGTNYDGVAGAIMVVLYSGLTVMCSPGTAMWIAKPVYNRMVTELRIVPSTKSSMEAVEALKVSEHNPTSPADLHDYILSKNNGHRDADVCEGSALTVVADIPDITPVDPEYLLRDDTTDQDTILTTLSDLDLRKEEEEERGGIPGYISGMLAEEGHYDQILGVPDHPRFLDEEEEDTVKESSSPVPWQYAGKATEGSRSPTSKALRPASASVNRGKRGDYVVPNKIDVNFGAASSSSSTLPTTSQSNRTTVEELRARERGKRGAQQQRRQDRLILAKAKVAHQLKEQDARRTKRAIEITRETNTREGPTGVALARAEEKKRLKNAGAHQQEKLQVNDGPIYDRTSVTIRDDKTGRFTGYKVSTRLTTGELTHLIPPTYQSGSRDAESHVVKAVSHAVQTDNKYYVLRQAQAQLSS